MERITVEFNKEWLSVADICEYMGVSTFVVTSQLRSGDLPAVKFGREWRVSRKDFEDWINDQRLGASTKATAHDAVETPFP
ncbi:MAG: helix-turn-helix domain-containing protein [Acidobacteria bacterium]|nr:helix-turn-helix domain-containing protein [Acidobacteriota bacterium]